MFYDVDGTSSDVNIYGPDANEFNYYDEVLLRTPGVATFTEDTELNYEATEDGLLVNAEGKGSVDGQGGITSLNAEQQQYAFSYTVSNTSTILFDYTVEDVNLDTRARNLLVDGGSLEFTSPTINVNVTPVPLPAGAALLLAGLSAFGFLRRRK
ncbi:VPLPA-CTERM sorting domain-containing protein [Rhodobacteraceae bacterium NNCM2]|nr:VPLPA-CTERM sorting domain-containing protein [Coraliihabitans acroporae]